MSSPTDLHPFLEVTVHSITGLPEAQFACRVVLWLKSDIKKHSKHVSEKHKGINVQLNEKFGITIPQFMVEGERIKDVLQIQLVFKKILNSSLRFKTSAIEFPLNSLKSDLTETKQIPIELDTAVFGMIPKKHYSPILDVSFKLSHVARDQIPYLYRNSRGLYKSIARSELEQLKHGSYLNQPITWIELTIKSISGDITQRPLTVSLNLTSLASHDLISKISKPQKDLIEWNETFGFKIPHSLIDADGTIRDGIMIRIDRSQGPALLNHHHHFPRIESPKSARYFAYVPLDEIKETAIDQPGIELSFPILPYGEKYQNDSKNVCGELKLVITRNVRSNQEIQEIDNEIVDKMTDRVIYGLKLLRLKALRNKVKCTAKVTASLNILMVSMSATIGDEDTELEEIEKQLYLSQKKIRSEKYGYSVFLHQIADSIERKRRKHLMFSILHSETDHLFSRVAVLLRKMKDQGTVGTLEVAVGIAVFGCGLQISLNVSS